jgi:hypothetical protein
VDKDFRVAGRYNRASERQEVVYFDYDDATLEGEELDKLQKFAQANLSAAVGLTAFASDEEGKGTLTSRPQLLNARLQAVLTILQKYGWTGQPATTISERNQEPHIEYRKVRRVQLKKPGAAIVDDLSVPAHQPAPEAVRTAFRNAITMLDQASQAIDSGAAAQALQNYFPGVGSNYVKGSLLRIRNLLGCLQEAGPDNPDVRPAYRYLIHGCDEAHTSRTGDQTLMTLGAPLLSKSEVKQAGTLIHEGSHAAIDVVTKDITYSWQRLITALPGKTAFYNADSYMVFVFAVTGQDAAISKPAADDLDPAFSGPQQQAVREALAYLEAYLIFARQDIDRIYKHAWQISNNNAPWNDKYESVLRAMCDAFRTDAELIKCPPEATDDWYLAGIFDRVTVLTDALRGRSLQIRAADQTAWAAGPGRTLTVSPDWLAADSRDKIRVLLEALIAATPTIPGKWRGAYAKAILGMADAGRYASL